MRFPKNKIVSINGVQLQRNFNSSKIGIWTSFKMKYPFTYKVYFQTGWTKGGSNGAGIRPASDPVLPVPFLDFELPFHISKVSKKNYSDIPQNK